MNLIEFQMKFQDEKACIHYLANSRWGKNNAICPHCKSNNHSKHTTREIYTCLDCKKQYTVRIGTIFEDSRLPLFKWFVAIYLFNSMKKGISSIQLSKYLSITQKSAWFMLQRIREVMKSDFTPFDGTTEIDEAYVGGRDGNKHANKKGLVEKSVIVGMVNRDTKQVKAFKVPSAEKENLLPRVNVNIKAGSTIFSDTFQGYKDLKKHYKHETVKHSAGEYVKKDNREAYKITTNGIEGVFSLLKRGLNTYHWISKKHLQKYLSEFQFRFDVKEIKLDFDKMLAFSNNLTGRLKYRDLIA